MKLKDIGSEVYKLIRETNDDSSDGILKIKGEKMTSYGKKMINLEMSEEFISIWVGHQKRKNVIRVLRILQMYINSLDR